MGLTQSPGQLGPNRSEGSSHEIRAVDDCRSSTGTTTSWAELVLVLLLESGRFPGDATETEIAAYIEWLEDMSNEWGVQLWDTYSIEWDESYFADEVHLNKAGTEAFTAYLAGLLNDYFAASD